MIGFIVRVLLGPFGFLALAAAVLVCAVIVLAAGELAIRSRRRHEARDRDAQMSEHIRTAIETVRDEREGAGL